MATELSFLSILLTLLSLSLASHSLVWAQHSRAGEWAPESISKQHQLALNYLLYPPHQPADSPAISDSLVDLLKDSKHNHVGDAVDLDRAKDVWRRMRSQAQDYAESRVNDSRPAIEQFLKRAQVSDTCQQSLLQVLNHIARLDLWAVEMYNSMGEFPAASLFEGSITSMGSYHQCLNVAPNEAIGAPQYCTLKFQPIIPKRPRYHNILSPIQGLANFTGPNDMFHLLANKAQYFYYTKLSIAACMPNKCNRSDMELVGKQSVSCYEKQESFNPSGAQVFALTVLALLASVSLLGTLVHLFNPEENSGVAGSRVERSVASQQQQQHLLLSGAAHKLPPMLPVATEPASGCKPGSSSSSSSLCEVLMHFSIIRNGRKLFNTSTSRRASSSASSARSSHMNMRGLTSDVSTSSQADTSSLDSSQHEQGGNVISCVHGLRFWTLSWIIFGHTMQYTEWQGFARAYQVEQNIVSLYLQPLLNATFSVDTFFLISGLLTTYVTWSITKGQYKSFNKFAFLISRYLRLTPQVMLVILLFIVFPLMGDGPHWRGSIQKQSDNCSKNWWVNALYLQAFVKSDEICNLVTWWLSIEMFYHFVSIFVIIALMKSTKKGVYTIAFIGGSLTAMSCYLHFKNSYPPNMLPTILQRYEVWEDLVLKYFWTPYPHAASYFVGLLLGYVLYRQKSVALTKTQVKCGWLAFAVSYLAILYGTYGWNNNAPYSRLTSTLYYNVSQILWSFATGWCILACAQGYGGWVNRFLSAPVFIPLGRATYMTYLSHMIIVLSYPAKMNLLIEPSYIVFLYIFISNLFLSYGFGIVLTLVYESPILHLQKVLVTQMATKYNHHQVVESPGPNDSKKLSDEEKVVRVSLYNHQEVPILDQERPGQAC